MPLDSNLISLNGTPYQVMADDRTPRGRRAWEFGYVQTQEGDPSRPVEAHWDISGPIGESREPVQGGHLGVDWSEIEHRYPLLVLPPAKRNLVTLSSAASPTKSNPDATSLSTSWSVTGAATFHAAMDSYDSPNDADYGSTSTLDAWLRLALPNQTDPQVDTGHVVRARVVNVAGNNDLGVKLRLYEGATVIATSDEFTVEQVNVQILDTWVDATDTVPVIAAPSAGTNRIALLTITSDTDSDTVNQATAVTLGGQSMTKFATEGVNTAGVGERRVALFTLDDSGIGSMSGQAIVPTWTTGTAPADGVKYSIVILENVNQSTPISDSDTDEGSETTLTGLTVAVGDMIAIAIANAHWISGETFAQPNGFIEAFPQEFIGPGPDPGSYHSMTYRLITAAATLAPLTSFSKGDADRAVGLGFVVAAASASADAAENLEFTVPEAAVATITDYNDLEMGIVLSSHTGAEVGRATEMQFEVPTVGTQAIKFINEDRGQLFMGRGANISQVNPLDMTETESVAIGAVITTMIGSFDKKGYVGFGSSQVVKKRNTVSAGGDGSGAYSSITSFNARVLGLGPDKMWAALEDGVADNHYQFAVGEVTTYATDLGPVTPMRIHDPGLTPTGIYVLGPNMIAAHTNGANSFTDDGTPQVLMKALSFFKSTNNGRAGDGDWRWAYIATEMGLFAIDPVGIVANPVGPGEGTMGLGFEGDVRGFPTAVMMWKDSLWVAYYDPDKDVTWLLRGMFNPEMTPLTGRPDWFVHRKISGVRCDSFGTSGERLLPTLIAAEDENFAHYDLGRMSRDIADSAYEFEDDAVTRYHYLTRLHRGSGMHKNLRYGVLHAEDVDATNYWQLSVSVDEGSYVDVGGTLTTAGHHLLYPVDANAVPLTSVNGHTFKPRLAWTGANKTNPAKLRGELTLVYDERPDEVEEHRVMLHLGVNRDYEDEIADIAKFMQIHEHPSPFEVELPGQNVTKYAMPVKVRNITDASGGAIRAVEVTFQLWTTAE